MNKLITQFIKFSAVGGICFVVDYVVGVVILNVIMAITSTEYFEVVSVGSSVISFTISTMVNYILSFKFVFKRKENLNEKYRLAAFMVLSVIGLIINSIIIWIGVGPVYSRCSFLQENVSYNLMYTIAKIFSTAIVMFYNFITRKFFLEQKTIN